MGKNQLEIFATPSDFAKMLRSVETNIPVKFAIAGVFDTSNTCVLGSVTDVLNVMLSQREAPSAFLALGRAESVHAREIHQKKGESRYSVDQLVNPSSVSLRPGALDNKTLLASQVGTATDNADSLKLFSVFSKSIRDGYVKVKSYWVGPEALRLLDDGGRLAATRKSPPEYDLRR